MDYYDTLWEHESSFCCAVVGDDLGRKSNLRTRRDICRSETESNSRTLSITAFLSDIWIGWLIPSPIHLGFYASMARYKSSLKFGKYCGKNFLNHQCWKLRCTSDTRQKWFPQLVIWWSTILYQWTDSASKWEVTSINPIDTRTYNDITILKTCNFIWCSEHETRKRWPLEVQRPMDQEQTVDGTEKIKLIWVQAKEHLV